MYDLHCVGNIGCLSMLAPQKASPRATDTGTTEWKNRQLPWMVSCQGLRHGREVLEIDASEDRRSLGSTGKKELVWALDWNTEAGAKHIPSHGVTLTEHSVCRMMTGTEGRVSRAKSYR